MPLLPLFYIPLPMSPLTLLKENALKLPLRAGPMLRGLLSSCTL